jgi:hypothetical protein
MKEAMLEVESRRLAVATPRLGSSAAERVGYVTAALLASSGLVHLALLMVSGGSWEGPLSLRKPVTFGLSFGLTLATIVWVSGFLKLTVRARSVLLVAFTAASVLETFLVSLQAWRGVPSHFNVETAFDATVTRGLAGGGVALVAMVGWMTIAALRANPAVPPSIRIAVRTGFVALCGAMAVGGVMIARGMALVAGGEAPAAYRTGGMLKPIHAVTMHGVLVLPLLAWLLTFTDWSEPRRVRVVTAAAVAYLVLVMLVSVANFAGAV